MKVQITRTTVAGGSLVKAGDVCDLSDSDAKALILLGKAVAVPSVPAVQEIVSTEQPLKRVNTRKGKK